MPPMVNVAMKPSANSIGVLKRSDPCQIVPSQLKIFTPVGTAMSIVEIMKKTCSVSSTPAKVRNGIASTSRNDVTSTLHVNRVIRENVMPGARSAKIVTIMFSAPKIDEKPRTVRLRSQRSWPWLGEYGNVESGTYDVQP